MSLHLIVKRLGGDLYDGGRRANIPAPGHSRRDRSVSLLEQDGRVVVHSFAGGDWREIRDHLRALGLLDGRPSELAGPPRAAGDPGDQVRRRGVAQTLWASGRSLPGSISERHCRGRGVGGALPGPQALRHHPAAPVSVYRDGGATRPALMAGIVGGDGALTAVELTYLTASGRRAFDLALPRKTVGVLAPGSAVRLDPLAPTMLVAEGVFTTLAARSRFALPSWALLSTSNLRRWRAPAGVHSVLIAADRGRDGEASAEWLAQALIGDGIDATIALPPKSFGDWDDAAKAGCTGSR